MKSIFFFLSFGILSLFAFIQNSYALECNAALIGKIPPTPQNTSPEIKKYCQNNETYGFLISGFKPGEVISANQIAAKDPHGRKIKVKIQYSPRANKQGNAIALLNFQGFEESGKWTFEIAGNQKSTAQTNFDYKPSQPKLMVIKKFPDPKTGYTIYALIGLGFNSGEVLEYSAVGPKSQPQKFPNIKVNDKGIAGPFKVPFVKNPADGDYVFELKNKTSQAKLVIKCEGGKCK